MGKLLNKLDCTGCRTGILFIYVFNVMVYSFSYFTITKMLENCSDKMTKQILVIPQTGKNQIIQQIYI